MSALGRLDGAIGSLSRLESGLQLMKQRLSVLEDKRRIVVANINRGETKEIDVAVVKATTSSFHLVPKEKHVRTLKNAVHPAKPRREVQYVIVELLKRLYTATDWLTSLKTLIVLHRLMRETDVTFIEELLKVNDEPGSGFREDVSGGRPVRGSILRVDDFLDSNNFEGRFDFSEWVRAYGRYLDEQLDIYSQINFYIEQEETGAESRLRRVSPKDLLYQLPKLQKLHERLVDCIPRGAAASDEVVQLALLLVVRESFKLYKAVSEGIINLADSFFEMDFLDAQKGLDVYKQFMAGTENLQEFYNKVGAIDSVKHQMHLPSNFKLDMPPEDFVRQMENYVKEAPRSSDGAVTKSSPPLRRGKTSKSIRPVSSVPSSTVTGDPGMVLAPGKVAVKEDSHQPSPTLQPPASHEVDLLGFDLQSVVAVSATDPVATPQHGSGSDASGVFDTAAPTAVPAQTSNNPFGPSLLQQDTAAGSLFAPVQDQMSSPVSGQPFSQQPYSVAQPQVSYSTQISAGAALPPQVPLSAFAVQTGMQTNQASWTSVGSGTAVLQQSAVAASGANRPPPLQTANNVLDQWNLSPTVQPQPSLLSPIVSGPAQTISPSTTFTAARVQSFTPSPSGSFSVTPFPPAVVKQSAGLHDPFAQFTDPVFRNPVPQKVAQPPSMNAMRSTSGSGLNGSVTQAGFVSQSMTGTHFPVQFTDPVSKSFS